MSEEQKQLVTFTRSPGLLNLVGAPILVDSVDFVGIQHAGRDLADDFSRVTRANPSPFHLLDEAGANSLDKVETAIIIGCIESCWILKKLANEGRIDTSTIKGKWETFLTTVVENPIAGCSRALIIAGSDKRAAIFGAYTLSRQIGVSPWYWWADVPAQHHPEVYALPTQTTHGEPSVQYRGIFINDEAPALTGWVLEKFGSYNSDFYKKVYELLLRLKANFMWPAMWPGYPNPGAIFFMTDPENQRIADEYGICVSTSHHEPMQRATTEWFEEKPRADRTWDWTKSREEIIEFFRKGVQRAKGLESYFTMGIRGEYDRGMTTDDPGAVIRDVLLQQRALFKEVYGREDAVPQVLALYKEIQDLYQAGEFTVPDDVTLLFADDNFGSLRRLPSASEMARPGGAGIYYHFEYVGHPRSYKWINSNSLGKTYHQLREAHRRNARRIWVFNVGDIKPIEIPLTFAMEMAWDINSIQENTIPQFLAEISTEYFGKNLSPEIVTIWHEYDPRWKNLSSAAEAIYTRASKDQKAAIWELVVHPVKASSIFTQLRVTQARNQLHARQRRNTANKLLREVLDLFDADFKLSQEFHSLLDGKWNHIMCQAHLGYGDTWHAPSRDAIFGLAYVQRHQDSNLIVGQMGVAVEGHEGIRAGRINEESERTHPSRRDLVPGLTLGSMSRYGPARRWFDIFTRGTQNIRWTVSGPYPWISFSSTEGVLDPDGDDARIWISIDWDEVESGFGEEALISIKSVEGDFENVHLPVHGYRVPGSFNGFVEADGCVSIPAVGGIKAPYNHHPDLGRGDEGSVTIDSSALSTGSSVPFLEYPFYVFTLCEMPTVTLYFNMTLDLDPDHKMLYDIKINDQHSASHILVGESTGETKLPAEGWSDAVMDCVWKKSHCLDSLGAGAHTIRVRLNHPNILLEKIVLDLGGVKESYLGPPSSFHVTKT
ncbi:hypothetical protein N7454_000380 [Penicillium verhagenii]|nr:hypothetical protein N7454_000380 [Penicillium verhagenii]